MIDSEKIGIIIENIEAVASKEKVCVFDIDGGFIGSDSQSAFCVKDKANKIAEKHIKVSFEEGFFTIAPVGDCEVFYNGSFSKMQSGFATIINKNDTFKISNVVFRIVDSKDINAESPHKESVGEVERYDDESDIVFKPRGKVECDFNEKEHIRNIIESKADYTFITDSTPQDSEEYALSYDDILQTIDDTFKTFTKKRIVLDNSEMMDKKTLEYIIDNVPLISSPKIINLLALSLLTKELHSPIFSEMDDDLFVKYINTAMQNSAKEQKDLFEQITFLALQSYKNKR